MLATNTCKHRKQNYTRCLITWGLAVPSRNFQFVSGKCSASVVPQMQKKVSYDIIETIMTSRVKKVQRNGCWIGAEWGLCQLISTLATLYLHTWVSEGFFPGGTFGDLSKIFPGGPNVVKFVFSPPKTKKNNLFCCKTLAPLPFRHLCLPISLWFRVWYKLRMPFL